MAEPLDEEESFEALPEPSDETVGTAAVNVDGLAARSGESRGVVTNSVEFMRVSNLPRRIVDLVNIDDVTPILRQPGGKMSLWPIQSAALIEAAQSDGLFAPLAVGAGKCCRAGTEVFDYRTGARRDVATPGPLDVASFDGTLHVRPATAFPSGEKMCLRVMLADGSQIEVSTDHPILTARGWVDAVDLTTTDFVAVAVELPEPPAPTQASDDEVAFVAYMLANGACNGTQLSFTNMKPEVTADFLRCATSLGYGISECASRSRAREFNLRIGYGESPVRALRDRWDLRGLSRSKRTHADVWGLPRKQVALFLNRFWACDGHVAKPGFECILASEKLIDDVRFLCARLGIRTRKHYKAASYVKGGVRHHFDAWRITMTGASALKMLDEVGDILGAEAACADLRKRLEASARNTNYDVVPIGPDEVAEICSELNLPRDGARGKVKQFLHPTRGQNISRLKFTQFCATWAYQGKYAHLATTDVAWERVASVVDIGGQEVYDLNVPGTHNFVANGLVVHNTALSLLLPSVMGSKKAVLLVPPALKRQLQAEIKTVYARHFKVPLDVITIVAYSELSSASKADILDQIDPDLIVADECHNLKARDSARTKRFLRFARAHPQCRFAFMSGTITSKSVTEYAHLIELALRKNSPLPNNYREVLDWAGALDVKPQYVMRPGVLKRFCKPGEDVRAGYRRRLVETPGVVATSESALGTSLVIRRLNPGVPAELEAFMERVRKTWQVGDEELASPLDFARALRQLACGMYMRWDWPGGVVDHEWLEARAAWNKEIRGVLKRSVRGLDSPLLCAQAAERARQGLTTGKVWHSETWAAWREQKQKPAPPTETVWISDYLIEHAATWGRAQTEPAIIWYNHISVGEAVAERLGLQAYGAGTDASQNRDPLLVASVSVQGTGKNLQHFRHNLFTSMPSGGTIVEQVIGRTHRPGQQADEVTVDWYGNTPETIGAMEAVLASAAYVQESTGQRQKILYTSKIDAP